VHVPALVVAHVVGAPDPVDELHPGQHSGRVRSSTWSSRTPSREAGPLRATPVTTCRYTAIRTGPTLVPSRHLVGVTRRGARRASGRQLTRGENGLYVVVGRRVQPDHLVDLAVLGGAGMITGTLDLSAADRHTSLARQARQIGRAGPGRHRPVRRSSMRRVRSSRPRPRSPPAQQVRDGVDEES